MGVGGLTPAASAPLLPGLTAAPVAAIRPPIPGEISDTRGFHYPGCKCYSCKDNVLIDTMKDKMKHLSNNNTKMHDNLIEMRREKEKN